MKRTKRTRLEAAGWRVGSAADFLELTEEEAAYVRVKLALAKMLRRRRQRRKLSQARVAELIGSSQSRVARMEAGDRSVSVDLIIRSMLTLGATRREIADALVGSG